MYTELSVQNYFYEFNCRYKYDICKQIINNLLNVSVMLNIIAKYFSCNTNLLLYLQKLVLYH